MSIKNLYFPVLDHGFVALKDVMGTDASIVEAARVSYGKGTKSISDDRNLIRYLLRHKHTTPFEMVETKFHISMPIHVHRQFIRHRTASTNEYSARYSEVPNITYSGYDLKEQSSNNKQGRSDKGIGEIYDDMFHRHIDTQKDNAFDLYNKMLAEGVAREQARMHLPLNTYTYFYWKVNLHNLFNFLRLRCDGHAQYEIRQYANVLAGMVKEVCPIAFEAWYDYVYGAVNFTRLDRQFLVRLTQHYSINDFGDTREQYKTDNLDFHKAVGMSDRELSEFWDKISIPDEKDFTLDLATTKTADEMTVEY